MVCYGISGVVNTSFVYCGMRVPCLDSTRGISEPTVVIAQTGFVSCVLRV